jgi:hypothetical protein
MVWVGIGTVGLTVALGAGLDALATQNPTSWWVAAAAFTVAALGYSAAD